jgi:hypothetical protein
VQRSLNTGNKVVEVHLDENYDLDAMISKIKPNFPAIVLIEIK